MISMRGAIVLVSILMLASGPARADPSTYVPFFFKGLEILNGVIQQQRTQPHSAPNQPYGRPEKPHYYGNPTESRSVTDARQREDLESSKDIQRRLVQLGYYSGTPSGKWSRQSKDAVRLFQASLGHKPTGTLTNDEKVALYQRNAAPVQPATAARDVAPPPVQVAPPRLPPLNSSDRSNVPAVPPPLPGESTLPEPSNALAPLN
jgi:hypothetical protein